jgi:hypothetical protein
VPRSASDRRKEKIYRMRIEEWWGWPEGTVERTAKEALRRTLRRYG